jgi:hypothetical protein
MKRTIKYCLTVALLCSGAFAAQDLTEDVKVDRAKGVVKVNFELPVQDILNKKYESKRETREVLKAVEKELKRLREVNDKRKDDREKTKKPADVVPIPEGSVDAGGWRVVKTTYVYPKGYNVRT